jgi:replicative DNA helicase
MNTTAYDKPLHDLNAERIVLGTILCAPDRADEITGPLASAEDFYDHRHGRMYVALRDWIDKHGTLEPTQAVAAIRASGMSVSECDDEPGAIPASFIAEIVNSAASSVSAAFHAKIVAQYAVQRRLADECERIAWEVREAPQVDAAAVSLLVDSAQARLGQLGAKADKSGPQTFRKIAEARIASMGEGDTPIVPTGLARLDEKLEGGLKPGELAIIAARPSMGKSALAMNMAEHIAGTGRRVLFVSIEMSKEDLLDRVVAARAGVSTGNLRRPSSMPNDTYRRVLAAFDAAASLPIDVVDNQDITVTGIRQIARRVCKQASATNAPLAAVFVDYLQIITSDNRRPDQRYLAIAEMTKGLKSLARELNVPVVCLSQLNRGNENREDRKPRLADLRESGSIEQDADLIMLLHREAYYHMSDAQWNHEHRDLVNAAEIIVAKNRKGATGTVDAHWTPESCRFSDAFISAFDSAA